jgi:hypothetical protein
MESEPVLYPTVSFSHVIKAKYAGGRITLPVSPADALYARLKHISGVPSSSQPGYPMNKLRAIDTLIDSLKAVKGERAYARDTSGLSGDEINTLMDQYMGELNRALTRAPSGDSPHNYSGLVVNFVS